MRFAVPALLALTFSCVGLPMLAAQTANRFTAYEHCKFVDDLSLMENTVLPSGVQGRTVKTVMGPKQVPLAAGRTLVFGYPQTEPFATVKVEQIPTAEYAQARQDLIANFEQILTGDDSSTRDDTLKPRVNGLEIYGLDRKKLEGGVLGIYLFFAERSHLVTTIYFLNQDASLRAFSSLDGYAGLRDNFVSAFTACAAGRPLSSTAQIRAAAPVSTQVVAPAPSAAAPLDAPNEALPEAPMPRMTVAGAAPAAGVPLADAGVSAAQEATQSVKHAANAPALKASTHKAPVVPGHALAKGATRKSAKAAQKTTPKKAAPKVGPTKPATKKAGKKAAV